MRPVVGGAATAAVAAATAAVAVSAQAVRATSLGAADVTAASPDDGARGARAILVAYRDAYRDAEALGRPAALRALLAPRAVVEEREHGRVRRRPINALAEADPPTADESRRVRRIDSLRVAGGRATAVLTFDYPAVRRVERVRLRRRAEGWRIVAVRRAVVPKPSGAEQMRETRAAWMRPVAPFRVIGNVYYVGASDISAFLIATPAGHVLLDTGPAEMLPQLARNVARLGFRLADVRLVLNSHAHFDHAGGVAALRRRTGARVVASAADAALLARGGRGDFAYGDDYPYAPVVVDRIVGDGDRVALGGTALTAMLTPGHTKGCTTWRTRVAEAGRAYDVVFVCGLVASPFRLVGNVAYPTIVSDVRGSLARLAATPADIMLAPHGFWFDLARKAARRRRDARANPFVDPGELRRHTADVARDFDEALRAQDDAPGQPP